MTFANDYQLLELCGHHIANLIEVDRCTVEDIMAHIQEQHHVYGAASNPSGREKAQQELYALLSQLSPLNVAYILAEIARVCGSPRLGRKRKLEKR